MIYFVDDEEYILKALQRIFSDEPYKTVFFSRAAEALAAMRHNPPTVVVTDKRMPGMDGLVLLAEIARQWPGCCRILMTASMPLSEAGLHTDLGLHCCLEKPWDQDQLLNIVRRAAAKTGEGGEEQ